MASRPPSPDMIRRLNDLTGGRGLSRRGLLRGAGIGALALSSPALLDACGTKGAKVDAGSCVSKDLSASQKSLVFSNWIGYIDPIKKSGSTLSTFEDKTGIQVDYRNGDDPPFNRKLNGLNSFSPISLIKTPSL